MPLLPAFIKKNIEEQNVAAAQSEEPQGEEQKRKRDYEIVDSQALYNFNPNLFKLVPNYKKITQALKLGFDLPGIQFYNDPGIVEDHTDEAVERL